MDKREAPKPRLYATRSAHLDAAAAELCLSCQPCLLSCTSIKCPFRGAGPLLAALVKARLSERLDL